MTELIMLGTGNAMVTNCYNTCFLLKEEEEYLLVDAGGGNQIFVQLEKSGVSYQKIHHMFLTHGHTDHILGAIWMVRKIATLISNGKYEGEFHIYCHDEVARNLQTFCELTLTKKLVRHIGNEIKFHVVQDGDSAQMIGMEFTFFDIGSTKMKQFGFRARRADGTMITCIGDEPYNVRCENYVKDSDWLLCEAFCLYEDREVFSPYEKHHSTALDAGKLAHELNIRNLLLYHTEDKNLFVRKEKYTKEAKQYFDGNVFVPDDLERIMI